MIFMYLCTIHVRWPLIGRFTVRPFDRKNAISFVPFNLKEHMESLRQTMSWSDLCD